MKYENKNKKITKLAQTIFFEPNLEKL